MITHKVRTTSGVKFLLLYDSAYEEDSMGEPRRCILQARPALPCKLYQYLDEEAIHRITTILFGQRRQQLACGTHRSWQGSCRPCEFSVNLYRLGWSSLNLISPYVLGLGHSCCSHSRAGVAGGEHAPLHSRVCGQSSCIRCQEEGHCRGARQRARAALESMPDLHHPSYLPKMTDAERVVPAKRCCLGRCSAPVHSAFSHCCHG